MKLRILSVAALALAGLTFGSSAAWAQTPAADPACVAREQAFDRQAAADGAVVKAVVAAFNQGGFAALEARLPDLRTVLAHAPSSLPTKTCDGAVIVRVSTREEALGAVLGATLKGGPGVRTVALGATPYPTAALLIGSAAVERQDYATARAALGRGLELAPTDPKLTTEAANTYSHLGRSEEALRIVDRTLAGDMGMPALDRARLLRSRGYALGELKRYDEAEAAYRESLKLQPGHVGAQNELIYIARMRAGARATPSILMTGDQAATTSADAVLAAKSAGKPK